MTTIALLTLLVLCVANFSQGEEDICNQPLFTGLCRGYIKVWGYDSTKGRCVQFVYGGCGGNKNRFTTKEKCKRVCGRKSRIKNKRRTA
ncbi:Protein AMBP [Taenia solium]|eukprot:TsM_000647700 transcript=TsM_000647700 gene=TsM_000647700